MDTPKAQYFFSVQSLNQLLKDLNQGKEDRRKVPIKGRNEHFPGLQAHPTKPKSATKYNISLKYSYKHKVTKNMVYVDLGEFYGNATSLSVIEAKYCEAFQLKKQGIHANFKNGFDQRIEADGRVNNSGGIHVRAAHEEWWNEISNSLSDNSKKYFPRYMKYLLDSHSSKLLKNLTKNDIALVLSSVYEQARLNASRFRKNWITKEINGEEIKKLKLTKYTGNSSYNTALSVIGIFLDWCVDNEYIDKTPSSNIKLKEKNTDTEVRLSDKELKLYLLTLYHDDGICCQQRRLMTLLLFTGLRPGEWLSMRQKHLDYNEHTVKITKERSKTGKDFEVPLSHEAWYIVQAQIKHTGYNNPNDLIFAAECQENWKMSPKNIGKTGKNHQMNGCSLNPYQTRITKMADIDYFRPHGLRHIFTTLTGKLAVLPDIQRRLVCHATKKDVHDERYQHHEFMREMKEASSRVATYLTYIIQGSNCNFDDFSRSLNFWSGDFGQDFMTQHNMEFKDMYILSMMKLRGKLSKTGLKNDIQQYRQILLSELDELDRIN